MRPTTANDIFDFNSPIHPGHGFKYPKDGVSLRSDGSRKESNSGILDVKCVCNSTLPLDALACRTEKAGLDRRYARDIVRTRRRPPESSRTQTLSIAPYRPTIAA
jgi:hypothetical protein